MTSLRRILLCAALHGCSAEAIVHDDGPPCACTNPQDDCRGGACVQPESACTPTTGCSAPYICDTELSRCACDPTPAAWESCAPRCDEQTACPSDLECDASAGLCIAPLQCVSDTVCATDEACVDGQAFTSVVWDGSDGYFLSSARGRSCQPGARTGGSECESGSDCGVGDCILNNGVGACEEPGACGPDEFRFDVDAATCYLHAQCRHDEDCPDAYACRLFGVESSGYCGRSP